MKVKLLILLIIFFLLIPHLNAQGINSSTMAIEHFKREAKIKIESQYRFNRYESIISGGLGLAIGLAGHFKTESPILKMAYGGIQTIGILTIGSGVYDLQKPLLEHETYKLVNDLSNNKNVSDHAAKEVSERLLSYQAQKDRALRQSVFVTTSLLSFQYFFNALVDPPPKDIRNIYVYLGCINFIVATYSFLDRSHYEKVNQQLETSTSQSSQALSFFPNLTFIKANRRHTLSMGALFHLTF